MRRAMPAVASLVALGVVFTIDLVTPAAVPFGPWYLLPIAVAAWYLGALPTAAIVALASVARTFVLTRQFAASGDTLYAIDLATMLAIGAGVAVGLMRIRALVARLAEDANASRAQALAAERRMAIQWSIRRAVPSDVDTIVELVVAGAQAGDLGKEAMEPARQQVLRATYLRSMESGSVQRRTWTGTDEVVPVEFWVSHLDGTVAGYFMVLGLDAKGGTERELHAIVTAESCRGMGLGSAMVDFFCAHYHGRRQFAACMAGGQMHRMFTQRGFRKVADTKEGYVIVGRPDWLRRGAQEPGPKLGFMPMNESTFGSA